MALKVVPATEAIPVNQLVIVVYGEPGAGKTTFAYGADNPYLIDFDGGAYRSGARRGSTALVEAWSDVEDIDLSKADTVIVDTGGAALDKLALALVDENAKMGRTSGGLSMAGWGALKSRFSAWIKRLIASGKDIVIITHGREEQRGDQDAVVRLDMQGGSKEFVYQLADIMGYLYRDGSGRVFDCSPSGGLWGKNPAGWKRVEIGFGTGTLAKLIADAKSKMGAVSVKGPAEASKLDDFNRRLKEIVHANGSQTEKRSLLDEADAAGYEFDKKLKEFV